MLNGNGGFGGNNGGDADAEAEALLAQLEAALLEALAPGLVDALVVHTGDVLAVCPLTPAVERKLAALCAEDRGKLLPPGLALVTSADRAAATLALLAKAGISMDVSCKHKGDATELRQAVEGAVGDSKYVGPVRQVGGFDPTQN